jgi:transcriptional repressor of cell division inhibition gene dicB
MLKTDVVRFFGRKANVARVLKIAPASVSGWGDLIPERQAARLERLTGGALVYKPELYQSMPSVGPGFGRELALDGDGVILEPHDVH